MSYFRWKLIFCLLNTLSMIKIWVMKYEAIWRTSLLRRTPHYIVCSSRWSTTPRCVPQYQSWRPSLRQTVSFVSSAPVRQWGRGRSAAGGVVWQGAWPSGGWWSTLTVLVDGGTWYRWSNVTVSNINHLYLHDRTSCKFISFYAVLNVKPGSRLCPGHV